jgi:hypothetical protein
MPFLVNPPQRLSVNILINADALAVTELDLDQAASLPGRHHRWGFNRSDAFDRSRGDLNRDKARSRRSDSRQAGPPPPREHQTAAMPCRRAISVTTAPGASVSSMIRILSSRDQRRRRSTPPRTSTRINRP